MANRCIAFLAKEHWEAVATLGFSQALPYVALYANPFSDIVSCCTMKQCLELGVPEGLP